MISVNIDVLELDKLDLVSTNILDSIRVEMKHQLVEIQRQARKNHRYNTHTGALEKSINWKILQQGLVGEVYLEDSIADYGVYVHEGHGARGKSVLHGYPYVWNPDRFLEKAVKDREVQIRWGLERAIQEAIMKAGL